MAVKARRASSAVDAMANFPAHLRLPLAQSFRFGPAIADEANKWLSILHAGLRLRGYDRINSAVTTMSAAGTVLCRTNAKAMAEAMNAMAASDRKVAVTGGGREILALAEAAITLKAGTGTTPRTVRIPHLGRSPGLRRKRPRRQRPAGTRQAHR